MTQADIDALIALFRPAHNEIWDSYLARARDAGLVSPGDVSDLFKRFGYHAFMRRVTSGATGEASLCNP